MSRHRTCLSQSSLHRASLLVLCALGVFAPRAVVASAPDLFGFGARGIALGNAVHASAAGFEAVWYNPAGMAFDRELSFTVGYEHAWLGLEVNDERWDALNAPALVFGFGIPVPLGEPLRDRLAIGMGFVLPTTSILIANTPAPGDLTYALVENRAQTVSIQGGLAVRLFDWLSIGWSLMALAELEGGIEVAPNDAGQLGSQAHDQLVTSYSNAVGLVSRPLADRLALGVVWREASSARYALPIEVDLGDAFRIPIPLLNISGTAQYDPMQVSTAVWIRAHRSLAAEAAVTWKQWSGFGNPIVYTAVPPGYPEQPEPGFRDTVVFKLGVEGSIEAGEWELAPRGGFQWEPSPVPEQTGLHNYLDSDRAIASLGFGARIGPVTMNTAWQLQHLVPRTHEKACIVGDDDRLDLPAEDGAEVSPTYPSTNPGCPSVSHGGQIHLVSLELQVSF